MPLHLETGDTATAEQEDEVQLVEPRRDTRLSTRAIPKEGFIRAIVLFVML